MQINSYQPSPVSTSISTAKPSVADTPLQSPQQPNSVNNSVQVTISSQGQALSASEKSSAEQLPSTPETPPTGEKLENYADFKKAQVQYQVSSDMINIATGNNDGISASTAAYLSNNEEARENVMQHKAMQQQYDNMQTYQEQTAQAQNNWVV